MDPEYSFVTEAPSPPPPPLLLLSPPLPTYQPLPHPLPQRIMERGGEGSHAPASVKIYKYKLYHLHPPNHDLIKAT